jgi:DNA-binding transcriptional LysR family regulator
MEVNDVAPTGGNAIMNRRDSELDSLLNVLSPMFVQFAEVARVGQVTRAAARLGVPQPSVTRHIARLENVLGVRLFSRTPRGLELTAAGRSLVDPVERALTALTDGIAALDRGTTSAPVSLGFLHTLGELVVPDLLRSFKEVCPEVVFALRQDSADRLLADLAEGAIDLCLTSPAPDQADLRSVGLGTQRLVLAVPEGHDLADLESTQLVAAASDDFVTLGENNHLRLLVEGLCRGVGFEPRVVFEASGVSTIRGLVAVGMGVSVVPPAPAPIAGLVEVPLSDDGAYREIALAWRASSPLPPAVQDFRTHAETQARTLRPWKGIDPAGRGGSA